MNNNFEMSMSNFNVNHNLTATVNLPVNTIRVFSKRKRYLGNKEAKFKYGRMFSQQNKLIFSKEIKTFLQM